MEEIIQAIEQVLLNNHLYNYLQDYPWLKGYLGDPKASVWFIGENPSITGFRNVHNRHVEREPTVEFPFRSTGYSGFL